MRGAVLLGASACLLLCSAWARSAELEAQGPKECPDAAELGFRVARNVHVALAEAPAVKFVVQMGRAGAGYVAHIAAAPAAGGEATKRELRAADCSELADAVVVALTLALGSSEPAAQVDPSPPATPPGGSSATPGAVTPGAGANEAGPDVAIAPASEAASTALRPSLSLALLVDAGSLPAPGLGASFGVEVNWGRSELRALGTFLLEQHTQLNGAAAPAPGADLELFAGGLLACTQPFAPRGAWILPACLGFELGRVTGVGTNVASPRSGSALWATPRLDVGAHFRVPQSALSLGLELTAATPLNRSRFALTEIGTVYRPLSAIGRLSLCIGLGFD